MSIELKPCPFCGGEAILAETNEDEVFVECCNCYAHSGIYYCEKEAIEAWNSRVEPTFTPDELDTIKRMFVDRYPRGRKLPEIEQSIIEKCANALKWGRNDTDNI